MKVFDSAYVFVARALFKGILIACVMSGCESGDESSEGDSGREYPSIAGNWSGQFYQTNQSGGEWITAEITQSGDAVIIKTSRPKGIGKYFSGSISPNGEMVLTDAFDGETWTTYFGPASTSEITIADFLYAPVAGESGKPPLQVIRLSS